MDNQDHDDWNEEINQALSRIDWSKLDGKTFSDLLTKGRLADLASGEDEDQDQGKDDPE